jgi:hypothetical protein
MGKVYIPQNKILEEDYITGYFPDGPQFGKPTEELTNEQLDQLIGYYYRRISFIKMQPTIYQRMEIKVTQSWLNTAMQVRDDRSRKWISDMMKKHGVPKMDTRNFINEGPRRLSDGD